MHVVDARGLNILTILSNMWVELKEEDLSHVVEINDDLSCQDQAVCDCGLAKSTAGAVTKRAISVCGL